MPTPAAHAPAAAEPQSIAIQTATRRLEVVWDDGHQSRYPWWFLRAYCPCAGCQGHGGPYTFHPTASDTPAAHLGDVREVGNYAVNLTWGDGHGTGIYAFDLLRRLCACVRCREVAPTADLWAQMGAGEQARWEADVGGR